ncbi:Sec-independent protein translocase protein TATC, chloroplastic [Vitis vinifera]|uniref:Sec-independent protein translocase protein TATC, chloroplastic n=1 Tax=Vitis vinifera TaxID=29760 RepID=A0A438JUR5_VITVI|nr:Sec-independent protein translocase protein TATC, chloroplastic [Vitis vinifera]
MGSTSGLFSLLRINNCCFFNQLHPIRHHKPPLQIHRRRAPGFGPSQRLRLRNFSTLVCSAVEDDARDKQQQLGGGVGSIVEERPVFGGPKDGGEVVITLVVVASSTVLLLVSMTMFSVSTGVVRSKHLGTRKGQLVTISGEEELVSWGHVPTGALMGCPQLGQGWEWDFLCLVTHLAEDSGEDTLQNVDQDKKENGLYDFLYPSKELLPDDKEMSIFDHLESYVREYLSPVKEQGVRFLQLAPGEFFFTTLKVSGYCGLLLGSPIILYEIIAFVLPGLTKAERMFLGPIVLGSSVLFYAGIIFSYSILTPAALNFFVNYAEGAVESLWSIDQYFEFVFVLMFSTGLSFQVPVIQLLLGQVGVVSGDQMLSIWRYVVVGAVVAAAVLTPSTDPLTQVLLAGPLLGLYLGGAWMVKLMGR